MDKKNGFQLNIGLSSLLLIFVVLCLISFSVLSLVSANSDKKLSTKIAERSTSYYNACNEAETDLEALDNALLEIYGSASSEDSYLALASECTLSYTYPVSDLQSLEVSVTPVYPSAEYPYLYKIEKWQVVTTADLEYDSSLTVIE